MCQVYRKIAAEIFSSSCLYELFNNLVVKCFMPCLIIITTNEFLEYNFVCAMVK